MEFSIPSRGSFNQKKLFVSFVAQKKIDGFLSKAQRAEVPQSLHPKAFREARDALAISFIVRHQRKRYVH